MKISNLIRLSFLELVRFKNITAFLVLNLTLGLVGFFLLQVFQQSLSAQSAEKAQIVLGGDISIDARRAFSPTEIEAWEKLIPFEKKTQQFTLFSMMRTERDTRLVNISVVDSNYPLYGEFKFSDRKFGDTEPLVWVDPEVQENFNLKDGEQIEIGEIKFKYAGIIVEDPTRLFRGMGFAPRVMIHSKYLQSSGLIKLGSTFNERWNYKLPAGTNLIAIKESLQKQIQDPVVDIESTQDSAEDSNRVLKYFTDYLGLVALVALGLCFLCGSYLLQWTFLTKKKSIAIYKTLGLEDYKIISIYIFQNILISFVACIISYVLVRSSMPLFQELLLTKFNLPLVLIFNYKAALFTAVVAVCGPLLMSVPQILQIIELRPLMLLQNIQLNPKPSWLYYIWLIFSVFVFWGLSVWQSKSFQIASIFTGAIVCLILLFRLINSLLMWALEKYSKNLSWLYRYSVLGLTRKRASAALVFTTMSLATLVLSLLPHVKTSIISEIRPEQSSKVPSLFLFDIQPDQVQGIQQKAAAILNQKIEFSPLVRARILKINDDKYERLVQSGQIQTREADQEARFRNRGLNLTYRNRLQDSETLTQGNFQTEFRPTTPETVSLPEISLEARYAERVSMKMGDVITFDVQGVEVKAKVGSLRQVRWTSFQPNFFILFPIGVLEAAPQIFLTSLSKGDPESLKKFQREVSGEFKNVSIIDVTRSIESSLKYIDQMALGLQFMAWLAVLVGLFVFIVLLNTQIKERLQEMNLLQILGADSAGILKIVSSQFIILLCTSILFGVLAGLAMAWIMISYFFKIGTEFDLQYLILLASVLLPVCAVTLYFGLRPLKSLNPIDLIRQTG
jgi:putative ABC transport system permease protein